MAVEGHKSKTDGSKSTPLFLCQFNKEKIIAEFGCLAEKKKGVFFALKQYNFIDLFAGCGGLSEGFYRKGFNALAHVEINHWACETLKTRMRHYGYKGDIKEVLEQDITDENIISKIEDVIQGKRV
ncbi:MAG: DNA cytosine methyltransferase, partial [Bacteroidales bacterium]|nr:DNA cytosine methyltransferase [Bacteroidales bacterium]